MFSTPIRLSMTALALFLTQASSGYCGIEIKPYTKLKDLTADTFKNIFYDGLSKRLTSNGVEFMKQVDVHAGRDSQQTVIYGRLCFLRIKGTDTGAGIERAYEVGDEYYFDSKLVKPHHLEMAAHYIFHVPYGLVIVCGSSEVTVEQVEKDLSHFIRFF